MAWTAQFSSIAQMTLADEAVPHSPQFMGFLCFLCSLCFLIPRRSAKSFVSSRGLKLLITYFAVGGCFSAGVVGKGGCDLNA